MTTVLIALDQSEASHAAALAAAEVFGPDADYLAINVADVPVDETGLIYGYAFPAYVPPAPEQTSGRVDETVTQARTAAARLSEEAGLRAVALGDIGDPATAITKAATEHGVDVIVVGWQEHGWFRGLFEKPVGESLLDQSDTPIFIVPSHKG